MLEVADRGALAQKFRIGHHGEVRVGARLTHHALDFVSGADRHGGLGDDRGEAVDRARHLARGVEHIAEVGVTVTAPGRGADRDEDRIGLRRPVRSIRS